MRFEEVDIRDVRNYIYIFELNNLIKFDVLYKIEVEGVMRGVVELNKLFFEIILLYVI